MTDSYPHWAYKNKREWKKHVRKQWMAFKKALSMARVGCAFHPNSFISDMDIEKADKSFKEWYKKA